MGGRHPQHLNKSTRGLKKDMSNVHPILRDHGPARKSPPPAPSKPAVKPQGPPKKQLDAKSLAEREEKIAARKARNQALVEARKERIEPDHPRYAPKRRATMEKVRSEHGGPASVLRYVFDAWSNAGTLEAADLHNMAVALQCIMVSRTPSPAPRGRRMTLRWRLSPHWTSSGNFGDESFLGTPGGAFGRLSVFQEWCRASHNEA